VPNFRHSSTTLRPPSTLMPLFGSNSAKANEVAAKEQAERDQANEQEAKKADRRTSLPSFSRNRNNRDPSPANSGSPTSTGSPARSGSILARFRDNSRDSNSAHVQDPTIQAARQKVTDAETAERDADRALDLARRSVREARQHVKNLEAAALEEYVILILARIPPAWD
jgi:hypothetical protein